MFYIFSAMPLLDVNARVKTDIPKEAEYDFFFFACSVRNLRLFSAYCNGLIVVLGF
jgi:hypothetical protein